MARTLTPERRELFEEALELRRAGLTEQAISEILGLPQQTISYWLSIIGKDMSGHVGNNVSSTKNTQAIFTHNTLTLYQGKYEDVGQKIPPESIDLIITDPPYVVANSDIRGKGHILFSAMMLIPYICIASGWGISTRLMARLLR